MAGGGMTPRKGYSQTGTRCFFVYSVFRQFGLEYGHGGQHSLPRQWHHWLNKVFLDG